ncbi:hypothetical protein Tco_1174530 [Tanacetum coccineum]
MGVGEMCHMWGGGVFRGGGELLRGMVGVGVLLWEYEGGVGCVGLLLLLGEGVKTERGSGGGYVVFVGLERNLSDVLEIGVDVCGWWVRRSIRFVIGRKSLLVGGIGGGGRSVGEVFLGDVGVVGVFGGAAICKAGVLLCSELACVIGSRWRLGDGGCGGVVGDGWDDVGFEFLVSLGVEDVVSACRSEDRGACWVGDVDGGWVGVLYAWGVREPVVLPFI